MSNDKDRTEPGLDELASIDVPPPDREARRRAIQAAVAAFEAAQAESPAPASHPPQGSADKRRLIVGNVADLWSRLMNSTRKTWITGLSTACVGLVAVGLVLQNRNPEPAPPIPAEDQRIVVTGSELRTSRPEPALRLEESRRQDTSEDFAYAPHPTAKQELAQGLVSQAPLASPQRLELATPDSVADSAYRDTGRDRFPDFTDNRARLVSDEPVSTFSVDVDTASYSFVRRIITGGALPPPDAVRIEELVNYFDYAYPVPPTRDEPFATHVAVVDAPWAEGRKLVHIGIQGYELAPASKPRSNLVFLVDVSGSMNSPDKLPLLKKSMELLLTSLGPEDTVAIAVYAGAAGTVLEPTPARERGKILQAIRELRPGGSTAGAAGIRLAYQLAESSFDKAAINRVILATDGDFNVGLQSDAELQRLIEERRESGIFLSVLGFGQGNYQDALMQTLAQHGNGVAAYIDTLAEAQKVLVDEASSTLFPIAKDVKIQVEFNPATVAEYRLIGYETRHLNREDFNNDAVDAGDIGAGHTVTAIYEITPVGSDAGLFDELRYRRDVPAARGGHGDEYAFLRLRYKLPAGERSRLIERPVTRADELSPALDDALARETRFATAVAGFGQLLRGNRQLADFAYTDVIELAQGAKGDDPFGYRAEFVQLVRLAESISATR